MADRVGQQFGNYRLIQVLGSGGFAEVYLAEHRQLGMKAAIKILHAHLESSEISAFRQEARTIADLKHPHIIRVLDFDVQNGTPFLVLDYASKGSLHALHPRGNELPLELVVTYVQQIASALQYAHEDKLIHRDVKPENILIGEHDELLLSDFGIATIAHSTSSMATSATMGGTLAYMAPEQIGGKPRPASDQYALAVTVYQWLTGHLPFVGSSAEIIAQHLGAPPPSLCSFVPDLPAEAEQVVLTALAKDPGQRFGSVQAFAHALTIASGQGEVASDAARQKQVHLDREKEAHPPASVSNRSKSGSVWLLIGILAAALIILVRVISVPQLATSYLYYFPSSSIRIYEKIVWTTIAENRLLGTLNFSLDNVPMPSFSDSFRSCTGTIDSGGNISATCHQSDASPDQTNTLQASINPDGHIIMGNAVVGFIDFQPG